MRATKQRKHVVYKLYKTVTKKEFDNYIDQLVVAGIIKKEQKMK